MPNNLELEPGSLEALPNVVGINFGLFLMIKNPIIIDRQLWSEEETGLYTELLSLNVT